MADHGYKAVTIDMIAAHAGISRRTFFNHYKNKQEAMAGPEIDRIGASYGWLEGSERPLLEDLERLIQQVVADASPDPSVIRNIGRIVDDSPDLQPVFTAMITTFTRDLTPLLSRRLGRGQEPVAQIISHLVSQSIALSFRNWTAGKEVPLDRIVEEASGTIRRVVLALDPGPATG